LGGGGVRARLWRAHPQGQERKSLAATLKKNGNDAYQARKFTVAADFYTRAIAASPQPEPVFYSNRAACYVSMAPPQHEKVVEDCDEALRLDSRYVKALNRRATALEALERYEDALRGPSCFFFGHKTPETRK
jgi:import receptor subunit TOM70